MLRKIINYITIAICIGCLIAMLCIFKPWALFVFPFVVVIVLIIYNYIQCLLESKANKKDEETQDK